MVGDKSQIISKVAQNTYDSDKKNQSWGMERYLNSKSTVYFSKGLEFNSNQTQGGSKPSVMRYSAIS